MWCRVTSAGDALCSYLHFIAIFSNNEIKLLVVKANFLYATLHLGCFLFGYYYNEKYNKNNLFGNWIGLLLFSISFVYWTIISPLS